MGYQVTRDENEGSLVRVQLIYSWQEASRIKMRVNRQCLPGPTQSRTRVTRCSYTGRSRRSRTPRRCCRSSNTPPPARTLGPEPYHTPSLSLVDNNRLEHDFSSVVLVWTSGLELQWEGDECNAVPPAHAEQLLMHRVHRSHSRPTPTI